MGCNQAKRAHDPEKDAIIRENLDKKVFEKIFRLNDNENLILHDSVMDLDSKLDMLLKADKSNKTPVETITTPDTSDKSENSPFRDLSGKVIFPNEEENKNNPPSIQDLIEVYKVIEQKVGPVGSNKIKSVKFDRFLIIKFTNYANRI